MKKPTLVLMAGLPGVGKTTLAFALGEQLGWTVLEKDLLKEPFLKVPLLKEQFSEDLAGWAAYEFSLNFTEYLMVNHKLSVILDTPLLYPFILERAKQLVKRSGARLKILLCDVDEDIRQDRLRSRTNRISQSRAHLISRDKAKQFEHLDPSLYKKIETKLPLTAYIENALTYVKAEEQEAARSQNTSISVYGFWDLLSSLSTAYISWPLRSTYYFSSFACHTVGVLTNASLLHLLLNQANISALERICLQYLYSCRTTA